MREKINNLPELSNGWVWTWLENCVDILDSRRVPVNADEREKRTGNVPYYGATGQVGWIDDYLFDEELVLLGEDGAPFLEPLKNKAYIVRGKSWVNNHAHVLRAIASLTSNSFVCHYLNVFDYTGFVSGTTRLKLNQSPMRTIPVPLPPLPEQHRIVAKIEELFTRLDAGVEALKKIKAQLKRYRQAVLKSAFEGKLTEEWSQAHKDELKPASILLERIKQERHKTAKGKYKELPPLDTSDLPELPEGWMWTRVGDTCETTSGGTPSRRKMTYYGGNIPWLKSGELKDNVIKSAEEFITEEGLKNSSTQIIPKGSLLMALYGATVGKLGILAIDAAINQAICAIFTPVQLDKKLLFWYLIKYRYELLAARRGGAQPNISQGIVNNIRLPLSPLPEQKEIVSEIERRFSMADEIEKTVDHSLKQAARLRHSILKRAFEGKLVPQDPNDEPAEKLLERIKTEKTLTDIRKKSEKKTGITARKKRSDKKNEKPTATKRLYDLLKSVGKRMTPGELLELSKLTIEDFYEQLEADIRAGRIVENRPNDIDVFLEVGK